MPVVSVKVDEQTASQIEPFVVMEFQELENIVHNNDIDIDEDDDKNWETVVDFWEDGITAEDFLEYLSNKKES